MICNHTRGVVPQISGRIVSIEVLMGSMVVPEGTIETQSCPPHCSGIQGPILRRPIDRLMKEA